MSTKQSHRPFGSRRHQPASGPAYGPFRMCAHLALVACIITMASVVSAQHQQARPPAAAAEDAQASSSQPNPTTQPPLRQGAPEQGDELGNSETTTGGSPGQRPTLFFDFDGDGVPDTVRREMRLEGGEFLYSRFVVVSGADGSDLEAFPAPESNDMFGWLVANLGDIDGDQVPDLAVTSPRTHTDVPGDGVRGRVHIISGATSETILTIDGEWWGFAGLGLVVVDDQDGDGIVDLLVGGMERIVGVDEGPSDMHQGDNLFMPDPLVDGPVVYYHATWALHSTATGDLLEAGEGTPPTRFLRPGENGADLWASGSIAGERVWLEGASGDLNGDGVVNMQDLLRLIQTLNQSDRGESYFLVGDLNADGAVDMADLTSLLAQYGFTASEIAQERAARRSGDPRGAQSGSGNSLGHCVDRYEYGIGLGNCSISCLDCEFNLPIPHEGGGFCPWCPPPGCSSCVPCDDCPEPSPGCTTQCECYPDSCECVSNDCGGCSGVDISVDSNNDGEINATDDAIEASPTKPGWIVFLPPLDSDGDGVPFDIDGYDLDPENEADDESVNDRWPSFKTRFKVGANLKQQNFSFTYSNKIRLWVVNADVPRDIRSISEGGDLVESGVSYSAAELGLQSGCKDKTLYVEALTTSMVSGDIEITAMKGSDSDTVRLTAIATRLAHISEATWNDATGSIQTSHPVPQISITSLGLVNPRPTSDGSALVADLNLAALIYDRVCDMTPGESGRITSAEVLINGQPVYQFGSQTPQPFPLLVGKATDPASVLRPFPYQGSISGQYNNVLISPGLNTIEFIVRNPLGYQSAASRTIDISVTPPPNERVYFSMNFHGLDPMGGPGQYATVSIDIGPEALLRGDADERSVFPVNWQSPGVYTGGDITIRIESVIQPDPQGPRYVIGTLDHPDIPLTASTFIGEEDEGGFGNFIAEWVITDLDRDNWSEFSLAVSSSTSVSAPAVPQISLYAVRAILPPDLLKDMQGFTIGNKEYKAIVWGPQNHEGVFLALDEFTVPRALYVVPTIDIDPDWPPSTEERNGFVAYSAGFGAGMYDAGVSFIDGVVALGKGAWYVFKNYNPITVRVRVLFGGEVILLEDQQRLAAAGALAAQLAILIKDFVSEHGDEIESFVIGEITGLNPQYQLAVRFSAELYELVRDYLDGLDDYERGKLCGRILGEVVIEVGLAAATGGLALATKGATMTRVLNKVRALLQARGVPASKLDELAAFYNRLENTPATAAGAPNRAAAEALVSL